MKKTPLLILTLLVTACSANEPNIGEIAKADSKAYEQIAKQYSKGESVAKDGEKLVSKGRKLIEDGRSDIRKGEGMIFEGNQSITAIRGNNSAQVSPYSKDTLKALEKANDKVEDGNKRIVKGNDKIKTGEDKVRNGRNKIEEGQRIMSKSESAYSAKR